MALMGDCDEMLMRLLLIFMSHSILWIGFYVF